MLPYFYAQKGEIAMSEEIKLCKICGKQVPLNKISHYTRNGKRVPGNICKNCINANKRLHRRKVNLEKFAADDSMKVQIHYKEINPAYILKTERSGIEPVSADEIFVKLLDYKDTWISNYGRAVSFYNNQYYLRRKKSGRGGEIFYQLNRNTFDGKQWGWKKQTIEAWRLVVKEFIVNYDIVNNTCCWHTGNDRKDNYYKHLYPLNQYQYSAVSEHYKNTGDDSEECILEFINSVDYRPDGWEPKWMKKSMFGIGYLGCSDVDVQGTIYRKWANMMQRCYSEVTHKLKPYYKNCRVCEEWWNFSNFREWYRENIIEGRQFDLDKDILVQGNNVYSPNTCALVTHYANTVFQRRGIETNIVQCVTTGKFNASATILGKIKEIGAYETREEAERQLLLYRKEFINQFAKKNRNKVPNKVYEAMVKWNTEAA